MVEPLVGPTRSRPRPAEDAPPDDAATTATPTSHAIPFADGPRVREVLTPEAQEVLLEGELEVVLFELGRVPLADERSVHGAPVIQAAVLPDRAARAQLLAKLYEGLETAEGIAGCYQPHHWLLARRGASTVELEVCFRCLQLEVHVDGETGPRVATSRAAEPLIEALVGPVRSRAFHGRTLTQWRKALTRAAEARGRGEDAAVDPDGLSVVARSLRWSYYGSTASVHQGSLEVLHALGAAAAPAVPELVEALRDETQPLSTREGVLRVLGQIGPGATAALPAVDALEQHPQLGPAARAARAGMSDR